MQNNDSSYLLVVVEESASRVGFYNPASGDRVGSVEVGFWPHEVEIDASGKTAYVTNFGLQDYDETLGVAGHSVSIIDLELMCERGRLYTMDQDGKAYRGPHGVKLRPGSQELFVNIEEGDRILIFDLTTQKIKRQITAVPKGAHNFVFSADGATLYLFAGEQGVYKMNPETGERLAHFASQTAMRGLTWMPGRTSLLASGVGELVLLEPSDLSVQKSFDKLGVRQILYCAVTPDGQRIIAPACWDSQILVINTKSGQILRRIFTGLDPVHAIVSPAGDMAWVTNARSRYVSRIDLISYAQVHIETGEGPNSIAACPAYIRKSRKSLCFGCVLPLSGAMGPSGRELDAGYQYWAERVNGAGGIPVGGEVYEVTLAIRDNGSETSQTAALTAEMIDELGAVFMLGGYPTPSDEAAGLLVNQRGVPMVTSASAGSSIYNEANRYVFGILAPAGSYLKGTIDVVKKLSPFPSTFCMLSSDDPAALEDALVSAEYAAKQGMKIVFPSHVPLPGVLVTAEGVVVYREGLIGFEPILRLFAALNPAMFLAAGHAPATLAILQQAARIGFAPAGLSFAVGPGTPSVVRAAGKLSANIFGPAQWIPQLPSIGCDRFGTAAQFAADFYRRYNMDASYLSAGAVACGLVYEDALRRAGTIDRNVVRDALASTHLSTFYWLIEFNERGINQRKPLFTIQVQQAGDRMTNAILAPDAFVGSTNPVWPFPGWQASGAS